VRRAHAPLAPAAPIEPSARAPAVAHRLLLMDSMTISARSSCCWLLLLLQCNTACDTGGDDDCDTSCYFDYKHCLSKAEDDAQRSRCDPELDQCRGICAAQPVDTGERR
jgi:hypothetical protein